MAARNLGLLKSVPKQAAQRLRLLLRLPLRLPLRLSLQLPLRLPLWLPQTRQWLQSTRGQKVGTPKQPRLVAYV